MSEALEITSREVREWLLEETSSIFTPVHEKAELMLRRMKKTLDDVKDVCKMLLENSGKEIEKRNMKTFRRARALNKLARLFHERIEQVEVPNKVSYNSLHDFVQTTQKAFLAIEVDIKNWFPKISPFFIMDRRKFQGTFEKAKYSLRDLGNFLTNDYVKTKTLEDTNKLADELIALERRISVLEARENRNQARNASINRKIAEIGQEITNLKNTESLTQISQADAEIEDLRRKVKHDLRHLRKPFIKLQSHVFRKGGLTPEQLEKLNQYIESPFEALVAEEDQYPLLRKILRRLASLMSEGKLKLKRDRRRKAEKAMKMILAKDSFSVVHRKCGEVMIQKKRLSTLTETADVRRDLSRLHKELKKLKRKRKVTKSKETSIEGNLEEMVGKVQHQKEEIEKNILDLVGKRVVLEVKV